MKNNKLLTIMLIILVTITLVGVIAVVLVTQLNKGPEVSEPTIDEIVISSVDVPEITTNLADGSFVRLQLKVQTTSEKSAQELLKRDFQVKNIVIQELSEMEVKALEGKQGKVTFQNTIKSQINELMQEGEVTQVYITSYIIP
ncbi:flagellar basal body-associated protein FliL [Solibacillus sp. R5-41]|uniref:flagellar basal body-associated protein FliL n=1 Tax=Solibacillus sp. R5-41 TaxID=2048654 RepID=UPI000C129504|nr:flagellar basal body-associated protein FliL [Solibacillus sp. R5-41]ATP39359.1 flagellar basal body-associated protein FliL [Solibacillus sp. R5-41]